MRIRFGDRELVLDLLTLKIRRLRPEERQPKQPDKETGTTDTFSEQEIELSL